MCYSAQIWAEYRKYVRAFGAVLDVDEYVRLFWERTADRTRTVPRAMDLEFSDPTTPEELRLRGLLDQITTTRVQALEAEVFTQRARLVAAEKKLAEKVTKTATESRRIATNKIAAALDRIKDLRRTALVPEDSRMYPGDWAPVMVFEGGRRVVKPMRFRCRPAGKPASYDTKYPGTYNARKDSLTGFWKGQFGATHGLVAAESFYEHVVAPGGARLVLKFTPSTRETMLIACVWSRWTAKDQPDLLSFAFVTDEPPPEVAAAGHDRCPIYIKPENVDRWLEPQGRSIEELMAILDDPVRPYYENLQAA